jgi:hypothetical protein
MKYQYEPVYDKKRTVTGKRKNKGVDIYCRLVDENLNSYSAGIEVYNWKKMHTINDFIYNQRIRNKFSAYDTQNSWMHVICMNYRNIPLIEERCKRDNIQIIGLRENITPELIDGLIRKGLIQPQFENMKDIEYYQQEICKKYYG